MLADVLRRAGMKFDVQRNGASTVLKLKERKLDSSVAPELKGEFLLTHPCTDLFNKVQLLNKR